LLIALILFTGLLNSCSKNDDNPVDADTTLKPPAAIPFANVPDVKHRVFYEVNLKAFGYNGNLNNVTEQLAHIKSLGVNVIWLMPIYPAGQVNSVGSPYCIRDYLDVDEEYGNISDLQNLVKKAHELNMAVVLDWVANHTAWDHPWIENNPDWYVKDASGQIISPPGTNWNDVAELNYNNPAMRAEMIRSMKFWIEKANIDGFRCDAADFVPFSFWKQAIDSLKKIPNRNIILLAEGSRNDHYTAGFQMTYAWDFYGILINVFSENESASDIFTIHKSELDAIPSNTAKLRYITNHDEYAWVNPPSLTFGSNNAALSAFVITSFLSPSVLIYNGQEIGWPDKISFFNKNPIDWSVNQEFLNEFKNIMKARTSLTRLIASTSAVSYSNNDIMAYTYQNDTIQLLTIANTRLASVSFVVPEAFKNASCTEIIHNTTIDLADFITMEPYQYLVLKKN